MLDLLFSLPLLGLGIFTYKIKVLTFIIKSFPTIKYSVIFFCLCMSGDIHALLSSRNKDILLKNFLCKYILINIATINLAYKIVFSMIF